MVNAILFPVITFLVMVLMYALFVMATAKRTFVESTHGKTPYRMCTIVSDTENFQLENSKVNDLFYPVWMLIDFLFHIFVHFPIGWFLGIGFQHMAQTVREEFKEFWTETKNKKKIIWNGVANSAIIILATYDLAAFLTQLAELER